ncbi:hypothetical protein MVEN_02558700 [Mycena venus]|uniref:Uncharacterized protein n=1 Tax=Mycena venus TaxID=2733690 RepID=A0A8H6WTU0_9AGAR|nr:hypothetical protein MVEN_02558700 [Mycena venus]
MVALTHKFLLLLPFAAAFVRAANDWSVKCQGECSYDTNGTKNRAFASVSLTADNSQILSDITAAASWELLDCPADWSSGSKDVRLVCVADDPAQDCNDVTDGGAVDTIVRLPENCGTGPFARIAAWGVSKNQAIPEGSTADTKLKLRKRGAPPAQVMAATLDWKLSEISANRGTVRLELKASNKPATNSRIVSTRSLKHALHGLPLDRRFGVGSIIDGAKDAAGAVGDAVGDAADKVGAAAGDAVDGAKDAAGAVKDAAGDAADKVGDAAGDAVDGAKDAAGAVKDAAGDAANKVGDAAGAVVDGAKDAAGAVKDAAGDAADKVGDAAGAANDINLGQNGSLDTITVKDNFPLFDTSLSCDIGLVGFDATVNADVDLDAQMNIGFAFLMNGTVVPPDIKDFGLAAAVSGYAKGTINIRSLLSGDIDSGNIPVFKAGIPGLSFPGLLTLGPEAAINVRAGAGFDVNADIAVPITWNFPLLDFVIPPTEGKATGDATESNTAVDFGASFTPGDLNADADVHIIPELTFGIDAIAGFAKAEVFISADADGSVDMNSTIAEDFSMDGCVTLSTGIDVKAGARGTFLKFFNDQTTIPIFNKRAQLFQKCFGADDGPASAILDNGDGTFTNAAGDLVNENGELIDDSGAVIPDDAAAPPDEEVAPILDEAGKPIPDDEVVIDNGDKTFEDGLGNPTNADGQLLDDKGNLLGSEVDLGGITDDDGNAIAADDVIVENEDGTFTANDGSQLDADGVPVDGDGLVTGAGMEDVVDEQGNPIAADDLIFDNEDGTYTDFFGNLVDQWGGAIDVVADKVLAVALAPEAALQQPQQVDDSLPAADTAPFTLKTQDEIKQIAADLLNAPPAAAAPPPPPRRKRSVGKRAFGCQPSFVGAQPVTSIDQLVKFF